MTYACGPNINVGARIQKLERATPFRRRRRKRARTGLPERPVGPKLVRGRGLRRRRIDATRWARVAVYVLIAFAIMAYVAPKLPVFAPYFNASRTP